jgi:hypothetical protein
MAQRELIEPSTRIMLKIAGWLLVAHGLVCLLGNFFPFYIPVFLFYHIPIPFFIKFVIVLLGGAAQVVFGVYLAVDRVKQVRWYWLVLAIIIIAIALMVYPLLNYFFGI